MDVSSIALQGLEQAQAQLERSAGRLARVGANTPQGAGVDQVDLSQEAVAMLSAKNQFSSNINVLKIADDMQKSVINLLA